MFTKNDDDKKTNPVSAMQPKPMTAQAPAASSGPQAAPRPAAGTTAPSIISADLTITGTLVTERDVQVDGRIEGDIRAASLTLGEKALVQGDIYAEEAIIRGRVEGSIRARKVQLTGTAHVEGNIVHDRQLSVDSGAYFEGACKHAENPLADAPESLRAKPRQVSAGNGSPAASFTALNA
jgi:cytoskeletal protein CcmA (bactofilin family)